MKPDIIKQSPSTHTWIIVQYLSAIILSAAIILLWIDKLVGFMIVAISFLFVIPAFVISFISFFKSLRFNTGHKRIFLVWHVANILAVLLMIFNPNDRCDAHIMEEHYIKYHAQMESLYHKVSQQLKPGCSIYIEFEERKLSLFTVSTDGKHGGNSYNLNEENIDSLLMISGLDRKVLNDIENTLDDIHCISIAVSASPDQPYEIGFRRILIDKYDFVIYPYALSQKEQERVASDPGNILYSPHVVFRYGTGAVGNSNFPGKEGYLQSRKKQVSC